MEGARILGRQNMTVEVREGKGKGFARELRREGFVPAVLYGRNREPLNITIAEKELAGKVGGNEIFDLVIKGSAGTEKAIVMVKDFQKHVIRGNYLHIDLHEISLKERMIVSVPLEFEGSPLGLAEGGIITQLLREVEVECLPTEIPTNITIDISELNVGDSLEVEKLTMPEGVDLITDISETILTITLPAAEEVEDDEETEGFEGEEAVEAEESSEVEEE